MLSSSTNLGSPCRQVQGDAAARPRFADLPPHAGAELDLLVVRGRTRLGFEIKRTVAPAITPSMRAALEDLGLTRLDVIHAGDRTFQMAPRIRAIALSRLLEDLAPLR